MVNTNPNVTILGDPEFANLIDELTECLQANQQVDLVDYLQRYPQYFEQLEQLIPSMQTLIGLGHGPDESKSNHGESQSPTPLGTIGGKLGDFRIIREIGRGGMGVVYEVEQLSLRRRMALKVLPFAGILDELALKRFKNEALAVATLNHPNIVQVHSVGCDRGVHYFAMQLIEGQTMADTITELRRIRDHRSDGQADEVSDVGSLSAALATGNLEPRPSDDDFPVTEPSKGSIVVPPGIDTRREVQAAVSTVPSMETLAYARTIAKLGIQAAEALDHAHANGILHRDIKPGNLMIDSTGKLWVTDFGLARIESSAPMTMTGDMLGTLRYMCPEMAAGGRERLAIDQRTDIYSLGVTLYEMLTLEPAFEGKDRKELFQKILFAEPRPLRQISKSIPTNLETIVLKAMRKDPADRYATAGELADDLTRFLDDEPIRAKPPSLVQRTQMWSRRNRTLVAAAAILLMVVTLGSLLATGLIWQEQVRTASALHESEENKKKADLKVAENKAVVDFLITKLLGFAAPTRSKDNPVTVNEVLTNAESYIETAFADQPLVEASIRHAMGVAFLAIGRLDAADRHLVRARQIRTELLGELHLDTLETTDEFAHLRLEQGQPEEARVLLKKVIEIRRKTLGSEHIDTVRSMAQLAAALMGLGEDREAEALLNEVVQTLRRNGVGPHDTQVLNPLHNLALILFNQGKYQDARKAYEELVELKRDVWGNSHPDTLKTMQNLANTIGNLGDEKKALEILQTVLELRQDTLGNHIDTFQSMLSVAEGLDKFQRHEEAHQLREKSLNGLRRLLKPDHPLIFLAKRDLAGDLVHAQKPDEAITLYKEVIKGQRRTLGDDHSDTLVTMGRLGLLLQNLQRLDEARDYLEQVLESRQRSPHSGPEHPDTLNAMQNLALTLLYQGEMDRARDMYEDVIEIRRRTQRATHPYTSSAMQNLGYLLMMTGELEASRDCYEQLLELRRDTLEPNDPGYVESLMNLANVLLRQEEYDQSLEYYEQALEIHRDTLEANDPAFVESLMNVGYVLFKQEEYDQAFEYFEQVRDLGTDALGADNPDLLDSMSLLAILYNDRGAFDKARPLAEDTLGRLQDVKGPEHEWTLRTKTTLAESLEGLNRLSDARQHWDELLDLVEQNPDLPSRQQAIFMSGMAVNIASTRDSQPDELERAIELANEAVELDDYDGECSRALGCVYAASNRWKESLEAFNKAVELDYEGELLPAAILERIDNDENRNDVAFQRLMELVHIPVDGAANSHGKNKTK